MSAIVLSLIRSKKENINFSYAQKKLNIPMAKSKYKTG